jgi:hypothetical protein
VCCELGARGEQIDAALTCGRHGLALAGLRAGFSRFALLQEILRELFVDLVGNSVRKSMIPGEI